MSATFEAKYEGVCGVCDDHIRIGERCLYIDDDYRPLGVVIAHVTCREPEPPAVPCVACFMVPASNGECECAS